MAVVGFSVGTYPASVAGTGDEQYAEAFSALSVREREVLEMAAQGLTNSQVGSQLGVTVHAVKFHLASVYRKLGVANRTEAAVIFLRAAQAAARRDAVA
jgi:DNA-binding NarL/FixJ family response regulator